LDKVEIMSGAGLFSIIERKAEGDQVRFQVKC